MTREVTPMKSASLRLAGAMLAALIVTTAAQAEPAPQGNAEPAGANADSQPKAEAPSETTPAFTPSWDQVANIKDAAERLGKLHRARGAKAAYEFIDACYRTHSLASAYSEPYEACIAQDYLETDMLAQLYSRMPPDMLQKAGAPTPEALADSMGRRVVAALSQYKMTAAYGQSLEKLIHEHGTPVFLSTVFPEAVKELQDKAAKEQSKDPAKEQK